jgi:hypothetical protein
MGLGMFTVLDAAGPDGRGLVRLDATPDFYYAPRQDGAVPQAIMVRTGRMRARSHPAC